ncbi:MAG TPA: hypothetical protein VHP83_07605 [Aggregatilineaceae bacterium]|nr:hypothetical protein [Aggregatilineaceae bacterium]
MDLLLHAAVLLLGLTIVIRVLMSAVRTLVLPRGTRDKITSLVFRLVQRLFRLRAFRATTYEARDRIMALYAPVSLFTYFGTLMGLVAIAYVMIFWAMGVELYHAFILSGSSLLTLGFESDFHFWVLMLTFSESGIGLTMVAVVIAYLPAMYTNFSKRESAVTLLEVRAGSPPSAVTMLERTHRIHGLEVLPGLFEEWEKWFSDLEETHTSLVAIVFFRSPKSGRSWVTAAGVVLDCAALYASTVDMPRNPRVDLCIRAGYISLRSIADLFRVTYDVNPHPGDPISVSREEFDTVYDELAAAGIPLKPDRDQCWHDYAGWRVNYDVPLLALAAITMAPYAPWISDRSFPGARYML